jgi:N-acetylglucosamine-6-sulfatase
VTRPNVIVIQTDDQSTPTTWQTFFDVTSGTHIPVMPNTITQLAGGGMNFTRYYVPDPLCCPSRASMLSGSYAKNNGVKGNGPNGGGYGQFINSDIGNENLAVWLQRAGYRTIHIGKFLNFYGEPPVSQPSDRPPGWTDWETLVGEQSTHLFYGYTLTDNGTINGPFGDETYAIKDDPGCPTAPASGTCNYQTDVLTQRAVDQINASAASAQPFFLSLDYVAPHGDFRNPSGPEPAPRHYGTLDSLPLPKPPGFNEGNVNDKPSFIRFGPLLTPIEIRRIKIEYRKEVESLRAVDDGVGAIMHTLALTGQLDNTYVFFTSDNGFFQGEHRLQRSKFLPYEPSVRVPLFVRGPGIEPGSRSGELVANIDLAPWVRRGRRSRRPRSPPCPRTTTGFAWGATSTSSTRGARRSSTTSSSTPTSSTRDRRTGATSRSARSSTTSCCSSRTAAGRAARSRSPRAGSPIQSSFTPGATRARARTGTSRPRPLASRAPPSARFVPPAPPAAAAARGSSRRR